MELYYDSSPSGFSFDKRYSNKSITGITYNALNLPKQITFSSGDKINYTYDASGAPLKQQITVSGSISQTYDYAGNLLFDNGRLAEVSHTQGRLKVDVLGKDYAYDYQYFLTDHLGNTRAMIAPLERKYVAGMESSRSAQENAQFLYVNETRYTGQARTGTKSSMLNAAANKVLGPSKGLKVYNGDQVEMKVWGKYSNTNNASEVAATNMLLSALSAAFGVSSSSTGESLQLYNAFNGQLGGSTYTLFNQAPGDIPKAHLNYLFFDVNYNYVSSGFVQVSSTSYSQLTNSFTADRDGYLFVYLANESTLNANVYFDDLEIKHSSADALLQSDDYYPFGLPMNNGFREAGIRANRFLYQGKEWQKTLNLNLYDFHARQFDPALGRFLSADAASQFSSPYLGMGNVPVMGVDPDGNLFFLFPSISFDGGFSISLTAGFGIPGIADISGTVGYNFQHSQGYASIGANAGPFSVSYGTGGFNANIGVGFNQSGFGFSLGGLNYNGKNGFSFNGPSVSYGHRFEFQNKPQGVPYTPTFPDINPTPINLELPSFTNEIRQKLASINIPKIVNTNLTYNGGNLPTVVVTAYKNRIFAKIMQGLEGLPYKWQANGPDKFDCSGAVCHGIRQVIGSFGDYTADQLYDFTSPVEDLKRGYLKFYDYTDDGTMDHVTTVLNSKQMLHPSSGKGVIERTTLTYLNSYTKDRGGKIYTQQINWKLLLKR